MFLKFREDFWVAKISKTSTFEVSQISPKFLPFVPLGSACGLASGRGSRGWTPLLVAAEQGHDSLVERLLEAKAAVDAQNKFGRGLGGGYWGGTSWGLGIPLWSEWRCWWFKCFVDFVCHFLWSTFWIFLVDIVFTVFRKACQNICTNVWCCSLWTQLYISYTLGRNLFEARILVWK